MHELEALAAHGSERSTAETEYYRVLCALVADYERSIGADRWPTIEPLQAIRELMALQGISQAQLSAALGDRAAASAMLNGRRDVSKSQAKLLAELFGVDAGVFI